MAQEAYWTTSEIYQQELRKLQPGEQLQLNTVTHWCQRGVFPHAYKYDNRWRIPVKDYDPKTFVKPSQGKQYARTTPRS